MVTEASNVVTKKDMGNYFIRKGKGKEATLFTRIRKRVPPIDKNVNTGIIVSREVWERANRDAASLDRFYRTPDGQAVYRRMLAIDSALRGLLSLGKFDDESIREAVDTALCLEPQGGREGGVAEPEPCGRGGDGPDTAGRSAGEGKGVLEFLHDFIRDIKTGRVKYNGSRYSPDTCKVWDSFARVLEEFHATHPFVWNTIDRRLADLFVYALEQKGYMAKTINKYVICFRAMAGNAFRERVHGNGTAVKSFSKLRVRECDKAKEIYLHEDELQALYEMKLEGIEARVRDVFLVGYYTCQRYSDYSSLKKENFTTTSRGTKVVRLVQKKTGNTVVVPVLSDNLLRIAGRYGFNIPQVSDVTLNRLIKVILGRLSAEVPSLRQTEVTRLTMRERDREAEGKILFMRNEHGEVIKPRFELVTSHTARRSGITNLYLSGLFDTVQMMSISGHRDERTFYEYIKLSSDEIADRIMERVHGKAGTGRL